MSYKINGTIVVDNSRNVCACCVTACCITGTTKVSVPYGTTANRPASGAGILYYDTDEGSLVVNDGTEWAAAGGSAADGAVFEPISNTTDPHDAVGFVNLVSNYDSCSCGCCNCTGNCMTAAWGCSISAGEDPGALYPRTFTCRGQYCCGNYNGYGLEVSCYGCTNFFMCGPTGNLAFAQSGCSFRGSYFCECNTMNFPQLHSTLNSNQQQPNRVFNNFAVYNDGATVYWSFKCSICGSLKFCQYCPGCPSQKLGGVYVDATGNPILHHYGTRKHTCVCSSACLAYGTPDNGFAIHHPTNTYKGPAAKISIGMACAWNDDIVSPLREHILVACSNTRGQNTLKVCSDSVAHNNVCRCGFEEMQEEFFGLARAMCNAHCNRWVPTGFCYSCFTMTCRLHNGIIPTNPADHLTNTAAYSQCQGSAGGNACIMRRPGPSSNGSDYAMYAVRNPMGSSCISCCWTDLFGSCDVKSVWFDPSCRYMYALIGAHGGATTFPWDANCPSCCWSNVNSSGTITCYCTRCLCANQCHVPSLYVIDTCNATIISQGQYRGWNRDYTLRPRDEYTRCFRGDSYDYHNMCVNFAPCFSNRLQAGKCFSQYGPSADRFKYHGFRSKRDAANVITSCTNCRAYLISMGNCCMSSRGDNEDIHVFNFNTCMFDCTLNLGIGLLGCGPALCWNGTFRQCSSGAITKYDTIIKYLECLTGVAYTGNNGGACCDDWSCQAWLRCIGDGTLPRCFGVGGCENWQCQCQHRCGSFRRWPVENAYVTDAAARQYYINPTNDHLIVPMYYASGQQHYDTSCNSLAAGCIVWTGIVCYDLNNRCISKVHSLFNDRQTRVDTTVCGECCGANFNRSVNDCWGTQKPGPGGFTPLPTPYGMTLCCCHCACEPYAMRMVPYSIPNECASDSGVVFMMLPFADSSTPMLSICACGQLGCCLAAGGTCAGACREFASNDYFPPCQCWNHNIGTDLVHLKVPFDKPLDCLGYPHDNDMKLFMEMVQGCGAFNSCLHCLWADPNTGVPYCDAACWCMCVGAYYVTRQNPWKWGFCCLDSAICGMGCCAICVTKLCNIGNICGCGNTFCGSTPTCHDMVCWYTCCSQGASCYECIIRNIDDAFFGDNADHSGLAFSGESKAIKPLELMDVCDCRSTYYAHCGQKSVGGYLSPTNGHWELQKNFYKSHFCTVNYPCQCCIP